MTILLEDSLGVRSSLSVYESDVGILYDRNRSYQVLWQVEREVTIVKGIPLKAMQG